MSVAVLARPPVLRVPPVPDLAELFKLGVNLGQLCPSDVVLLGPVRSAIMILENGGEPLEELLVRYRKPIGSAIEALSVSIEISD